MVAGRDLEFVMDGNHIAVGVGLRDTLGQFNFCIVYSLKCEKYAA